MEIGWIGTGIMGAPMALRLVSAGNRVRAFNRTAEKARALASEGGHDVIVAADAASAVASAEVVFIMVPDTPDVEATVAKIEPALKKGQLVIDMSTISPRAERSIAADGNELARLDCVAGNHALRDYYEHAGYRFVGFESFPDLEWATETALYEKPIQG